MSQIFRKLRILAVLVAATYEGWVSEVWRRDLDDTACCNGYECGCYGASIGEMYGEKRK